MSRQESSYHSNRKDRRENQQKQFGIGSWYGTGEYYTGFNRSCGDYGVPPKRIRSNDRYNQRSQSIDDHMKLSQQDNDFGLYTDFSADVDRDQQMEKPRGRNYGRSHHSGEHEKSFYSHRMSRNLSQSDAAVYRQQHSSKLLPTGREKHQGGYFQDSSPYKVDPTFHWKSPSDPSKLATQRADPSYFEHPASYRAKTSRQFPDFHKNEDHTFHSANRTRDSYYDRNEPSYSYDKESSLYQPYKEMKTTMPDNMQKRTPSKEDGDNIQSSFLSYPKGHAERFSEIQSKSESQKPDNVVEALRISRGKEYPPIQARKDESVKKACGSKSSFDGADQAIDEQKGKISSKNYVGKDQIPGDKNVIAQELKVAQDFSRNEEISKRHVGDANVFSVLEDKLDNTKANEVFIGREKNSLVDNLSLDSTSKDKIGDDNCEDSLEKSSVISSKDQNIGIEQKDLSSEIKVEEAEQEKPETEEEIVSKLDKMDKDILECEQSIKDLEAMKTQLENEIEELEGEMTNSKKLEKTEEKEELKAEDETRDELMQYFIDKFTPRDTNLVSKIYNDNKMKAKQAHSTLAKLNNGEILSSKPLYNQPSDLPFYYENIRTHKQFRRKLVNFLRLRKSAITKSNEAMKQQYEKRKELWLKKVEKIENNIKRRAKLAKVRVFYEREFPEIKRQREQQERMTRLGSRSSWGAFARSEAEFEEIIDNLTELEATEKHMHQLAVHPPNLLHKCERRVQFRNRNGLIKDVEAFERDRKFGRFWTEQERAIYKKKFAQYPKDFSKIAEFLDKKSVSDCVLYYYQNKKKENFKVSSKKTGKKAGRLQRQLVSTLTYAQPIPHIQNLQQPIKTRQKEREREKEREKVKETEKIEKEVEPVQGKCTDIQKEARIPDDQPINIQDKTTCPVPDPTSNDAASVPVNQDETRQSVDELIAKYLAKKPLHAEMVDPSRWSEVEISKAVDGLKHYGRNWSAIAKLVSTKSEAQCKNFYFNYKRKFHLESILGIAKQGRRSSQISLGSSQKQSEESEARLKAMRSHKSLRASNSDADIPSASVDNALRDDDVDMAVETSQIEDIDNEDDSLIDKQEIEEATTVDSQTNEYNDDNQTQAIDNMKQDDAVVLNQPLNTAKDELANQKLNLSQSTGSKEKDEDNSLENETVKDVESVVENDKKEINETSSNDTPTCRLLPPPLTPVTLKSTTDQESSAKVTASIAGPILHGISLQGEIGAFKKKFFDISFSTRSDSKQLYNKPSLSTTTTTNSSGPITSKLFQRDVLYEPRLHLQPRMQTDTSMNVQPLSEAKSILRPPFLTPVIRPSVEQSSVIEAFTARNPPVMTVHAIGTSIQGTSAKYQYSGVENTRDGGKMKTMDLNIPRDTKSPRLPTPVSAVRSRHVNTPENERRFIAALGLNEKNINRQPIEMSLRQHDMNRTIASQQHLDMTHAQATESQKMYMQHHLASQIDEQRAIQNKLIPQQFGLKAREQRPRTVSEIYERSATIPSLSINRSSSAPQVMSRYLSPDSNQLRYINPNIQQFDSHHTSNVHSIALSRADHDLRMSTSSVHSSQQNQNKRYEDQPYCSHKLITNPSDTPLDQRLMPVPLEKGIPYQGIMHEMPEYSTAHQLQMLDKRYSHSIELNQQIMYSRASVLTEATSSKMQPIHNVNISNMPHRKGSIDAELRASIGGNRRSIDASTDPKYRGNLQESIHLSNETAQKYSDVVTDPRYGISTGLVQRMPRHTSITGTILENKNAIKQHVPPQLDRTHLLQHVGHFHGFSSSITQDFNPRHAMMSSRNAARIKRSAKNGRPSSVDSVIQKSLLRKTPSSLSLSLCDLTSALCSSPCSPNLSRKDEGLEEIQKSASSVFRPWEKTSMLNEADSSHKTTSPAVVDSSLMMTTSTRPLSISTDKCNIDISHDDALMSPTFPIKDQAIEAFDADADDINKASECITSEQGTENESRPHDDSIKPAIRPTSIGGQIDVKDSYSEKDGKIILPIDSEGRQPSTEMSMRISIDSLTVDSHGQRSPTDSEATLSADETKLEIENINKYENSLQWNEKFTYKDQQLETIKGIELDGFEKQIKLNQKEDGRSTGGVMSEGQDDIVGKRIREKNGMVTKKIIKSSEGKIKKSVSKGPKRSAEKSKKMNQRKIDKKKNEAEITDIEKIVTEEHEKEADTTDETIETSAAIDSIQPKNCESTSSDEDQIYDIWMTSNVYECQDKANHNNTTYDIQDVTVEGNRSHIDNFDNNESNCPSSDEIYHPDYETISISPPASPITPVDSLNQTEPVSTFTHSVLSLGFSTNPTHQGSPKSHLNPVAFPYSTLSLNVGSRPTSRHSSRPGSTCASPNIMTNLPSSPNNPAIASFHRSDNIQEASFTSQNEHLRHLTEQLLRDDNQIPRNDEPGSVKLDADASPIDRYPPVMTYEPLSDED